MDDDGLRNWVYYEEPLDSQLNLQLMSNVVEQSSLPGRDSSGAMVNANGSYHHHNSRDCVVSEAPMLNQMNYGRDSWFNQRDNRFPNMVPSNLSYNHHLMLSHSHHSLHMLQPSDLLKDDRVVDEEIAAQTEDDINTHDDNYLNKRKTNPAPKTPKTKKARKNPVIKDNGGSTSVKPGKITTKKSTEIFIEGIDMDISGIPIPVCSCTATPQQCYRWGCGGWQSACCTTSISMYPLPMSAKRRGARIAGRKMSQGAFKKVLEKLASEGYNFSNPIDLKSHWAKHGTNKFVTIK